METLDRFRFHRTGSVMSFCERENREYGTGGSRTPFLFAAGFYFDRWLHRHFILIQCGEHLGERL